jgi:hypothetical protein
MKDAIFGDPLLNNIKLIKWTFCPGMTGWKKAISPHVTYALSGYGSTQTPDALSLFVSDYCLFALVQSFNPSLSLPPFSTPYTPNK